MSYTQLECMMLPFRPYLKFLWHGTASSAGDNERNKKERKTEEEVVRQHQRIDSPGVWRFPEGSRRRKKVERYYERM